MINSDAANYCKHKGHSLLRVMGGLASPLVERPPGYDEDWGFFLDLLNKQPALQYVICKKKEKS